MSHMSRAFQTSLLITAQRNDCRILCCREEAQKKNSSCNLALPGCNELQHPKRLGTFRISSGISLAYSQCQLIYLHIYITFGFLNIFGGGKLSGVIAVVYILCQPGSIYHHFGQGLFGPHEEVLLSKIIYCILQRYKIGHCQYLSLFQHACAHTHTPKSLPEGYTWIPFVVGLWHCLLWVCCNFTVPPSSMLIRGKLTPINCRTLSLLARTEGGISEVPNISDSSSEKSGVSQFGRLPPLKLAFSHLKSDGWKT